MGGATQGHVETVSQLKLVRMQQLVGGRLHELQPNCGGQQQVLVDIWSLDFGTDCPFKAAPLRSRHPCTLFLLQRCIMTAGRHCLQRSDSAGIHQHTRHMSTVHTTGG